MRRTDTIFAVPKACVLRADAAFVTVVPGPRADASTSWRPPPRARSASFVRCNESENMGEVFIATAGWSIPRAHASDIPGGGSGLERYAAVLAATEINTTFYRLHRRSTLERWRDSVPAAFRFAVKVPRAITHEGELASARRPLRDLFTLVEALGPKLGPVLVQLPASLAFDGRRAGAFFRTLRTMHDGPVACEPRNASWYGEAATATLVRYGIARVAADPPRPDPARAPAGARSLIYYRWHGSPHVYWSSYDDARLTALADAIRQTSAHSAVWCVFDNTASGEAFSNALRLRRLLGDT
jgi:uncharacterized protein YecE (DUF72 family)